MTSRNAIIGGGLLIAGTSIGGGMLALPVATSVTGFLPTLLVYLLSAIIMGSTALLMAEVVFSLEGNPNLITMAETTLGRWAKWAVWGLYLFLFYCLMVAYLSGLGGLLCSFFGAGCFPFLFPPFVAAVTFLMIYSGVLLVERVNAICMLAMGITFMLFLFLGMGEVEVDWLRSANWNKIGRALPISFTAFAFQGIIPTIVRSLKGDRRAVRQSIAIGVALPLACYILWHLLIAGVVPRERLLLARELGQSAIIPLGEALSNSFVRSMGTYFGFFALVTSLLGVSLSLRDFFIDGLHLQSVEKGRLFACGLTLLPPLFISALFPNLFLTALEAAGGVGCAILLGLFPVMMAWKVLKRGHWYLAILAALILLELAYQLRIL